MRYLICLLVALCVSCSSTPESANSKLEVDNRPPVNAEEAEHLDEAWEGYGAQLESQEENIEPTEEETFLYLNTIEGRAGYNLTVRLESESAVSLLIQNSQMVEIAYTEEGPVFERTFPCLEDREIFYVSVMSHSPETERVELWFDPIEEIIEPTQLAYELIVTWPIDSEIFGQIIKEIYQIQIQGSGDVVVRVDSEHIRWGNIFLELDGRHVTGGEVERISGVRTSRTSLECRFENPGSSGTIFVIVTSYNEEKLDYELTVTEIKE